MMGCRGGFAAVPIAAQVGRHDRETLGQARGHEVPHRVRLRMSVEQQKRWSGPAPPAVNRGFVGRDIDHIEVVEHVARPYPRHRLVRRHPSLRPSGMVPVASRPDSGLQFKTWSHGERYVLFLASANDPRQVEFETNAIDAAMDAGIEHVVKLSALGAAIGSRLHFWDWHGRIEQHLQGSGPPTTILRPSNYMSGLFAAAGSIQTAGKIFGSTADAKVPMIDPRDVAAFAAIALTGGPQGQDLHTDGTRSSHVRPSSATAIRIDWNSDRLCESARRGGARRAPRRRYAALVGD
jgi:hypothetical protein